MPFILSLQSPESHLISLPVEILLMIWEEVLPDDVVSFAFSCKSVHQLASPFLSRHKELHKAYCHVAPTGSLDERNSYHGIFFKVLQDPRIKVYIRSLRIQLGLTDDLKLYLPTINAHLELIFTAIDHCSYIEHHRKEYWKQTVAGGTLESMHVLAALLVARLPNLRTLRLCPLASKSELLKEVTDNIADEFSQKRKPATLCKLSTIQMTVDLMWSESTSSPIDLARIATLGRLPSMTKLHGIVPYRRLSRDQIDRSPEREKLCEAWLDCQPKLGLTTVKLSNYADWKGSIRLLQSLKGLQSFTGKYSFDVPYRMPGRVLDSLYPFLYTLETLSLYAEGSKRAYSPSQTHTIALERKFVGSLQGFKVLKTISLELPMLVDSCRDDGTDEPKSAVYTVAEFLPTSCVTFKVWIDPRVNELNDDIRQIWRSKVENVLEQLPTMTADKFPNLREVRIRNACLLNPLWKEKLSIGGFKVYLRQ